MGAIATFDPQAFDLRYPEFASLDDNLVAAYFTEATLYHRNDGSGPIQDPAQQLMLLNMLTAHIASMNAPGPNGKPTSSIVGRLSHVSQGSVDITAEYTAPESGSMAWFLQTKYGAAYWQATASFRTMLYRHGPVYTPYPSRGIWRR